MRSLCLKSPAKLNLYLKVINKRPDGFHNIETLFERIDLCDDIYFTPNREGGVIRIDCDHPQVPRGPKNLVYKAVRLIQDDLGIKKGVDIRIHKRIPVAAGLAGGSSNAATTLLGINQLWKLDLPREKLLNYARQLGSDVAFFLYDCRWALGTQRGDLIKRLNLRAGLWHVVVVPHIKMYSWKVYGGLKLQLTKRNDDVNILLRYLKNNKISKACSLLANDLEPEIIRLCPRVGLLKNRLKAFDVKGVLISGSGPAVYGVVDSEEEGKAMAGELSKRFSRVFVVSSL